MVHVVFPLFSDSPLLSKLGLLPLVICPGLVPFVIWKFDIFVVHESLVFEDKTSPSLHVGRFESFSFCSVTALECLLDNVISDFQLFQNNVYVRRLSTHFSRSNSAARLGITACEPFRSVWVINRVIVIHYAEKFNHNLDPDPFQSMSLGCPLLLW